MELVGGGSVIIGATPSSFYWFSFFLPGQEQMPDVVLHKSPREDWLVCLFICSLSYFFFNYFSIVFPISAAISASCGPTSVS